MSPSRQDTAYDTALTIDPVVVTVRDNDTADVTVTPTSRTINEGSMSTYTVVLDTPPTAAVTVMVTSDNAAVTTNTNSLMFTDRNWNMPQTVTLTAVEDANAVSEMVNVTHAASSQDTAYDTALMIDPVVVTVTDNDMAGVTVTPTSRTMDEGSMSTYTVVLDTRPTAAVTVMVTSDNAAVTATATPALPLMFTSTNWNIPQTVTLTAVEDGNTVSEMVNVTHAARSQDNAYDTGLTIDPVVVTVRDNDMAGVTVTPTSRTMDEGSMGTYTVVLRSQPTAAVTVMVTSGNAAVTAAATPALPLMFTSTNWNIPQTVTLTAVEDANAVSEMVNVTHAASSQDTAYNNTLTIDPVVVSVVDNDTAGVTVTPTSRAMDEGSMSTYTVVLDTPPTAAVTVMVTSGNAAVTTNTNSLMFTDRNWNMPQTVTLTAVEDGNTVSERVNVTHAASSQDTAYDTALTIDPVVVTVRDNDMAGVTVTPTSRTMDEGSMGTYTVVLRSQPTAAVTVMVTSGNAAVTATATPALPLMFTSTNWNMPQTVTLTAVEDGNAVSERVNVTHAASSQDTAYDTALAIDPVVVSVVDNDTAGVTVTPTSRTINEGSMGTYTVVLDTLPTAAVTVMVTSGNAAVTATATPALPLMFTSTNWNIPQTVTLTAVEDGNTVSERVNVTHAASSQDTAYDTALMIDPVVVSVADNDTAGVTVTPTSRTIDEGSMGTYTVVLRTQPTDAVTVMVTSGNAAVTATATPALPLMFTSTNWNMPQTVTLTAIEDANMVSERVNVTHAASSQDTAYNNTLTIDPVVVTVRDNDMAGVTVTPTSRTMDEGSMGTYTVVLDTRPTAAVTVMVTSGNAAVTAAATPALPLMFTSTNWNIPQTVTLTAVEDANTVSEMVNVTHAASSQDTAYNNTLTIDPVVVSVVDNDTAGVTVTPTSRTMDEGSMGTYTVVLDTPPTAAVAVMVTSDNAAVTTNTNSLMFTDRNWNMPQTVTLTAVEDGNTVSEMVNVTHAASSQDTAYNNTLTIDPVVVSVVDNDTAGVTVTPTSRTIDEGSMSTYTVVLDTRPTAAVTVMVTSGNAAVTATATPALPLMFTSTNWNMPQTVTLTAVEDGNTVSEMVNVTHAARSQDNAYDTGLTIDPVVVTVRDNDMAGVTVTPTSRTIDEDSMGTYTVVLRTRPTAAVTVMVTSGNAAVTAAATPALPLMFTSTNWNIPQTVTLTAVEDGNAVSEMVNVTHAASSQDTAYNNTLTIDPVVVSVVDNDTAGVTVTPTSRAMDEGSMSTYTVVLDTPPTAAVTVMVTSDNAAVTTNTNSLMFTDRNWNMPQTVTLTAVEDGNTVSEMVNVTHAARSQDNAYDTALAIDPVVVTVRDNDMAGVTVTPTSRTMDEGSMGTYTVVLRSQPTAAVTVMVTSGNAAVTAAATPALPLMFTSTNWNIPQTVTLTAVEDGNTVSEMVNVTHAASSQDTAYDTALAIDPVVVTVRDNDMAGVTVTPTSRTMDEGSMSTYTVVLDTRPTAAVTVMVTSGNAAVTATATPALPLMFSSTNWNMPQTVTLTAVEDANAVSEMVNVRHAASSQDTAYDTALAIDPVVVTVRDNDMAGVTVTPTSRTIDEDSMGTYTVVLRTRPTAAVTVMVTSGNAAVTAAATPALPLMFTSTNWNIPQTVTLTAVEDANAVSEMVNVTHAASSQDTAYNTALMIDPVVVTVRDNDMAGVTVTPTSRTINEGSMSTYTVVLDTRPTAAVTVMVTSGNAAVTATATPALPLRFTSTNWNMPQTVTLTAVEDGNTVSERVNVTHAASSQDTAYNTALTIDPVVVTVRDNDMASVAGVTVTPTSRTINEGSMGTYTVVLDTRPTAAVTVMVTSGNVAVTATATPALPLRFTSTNWNIPQTVTLTAVEDGNTVSERVNVTHAASSQDTAYNTALTIDPVVVTVRDNDMAGVTVTPTSRTIDEGSMGTYTVVLDTRPTAAVTVMVTSGNAAVTATATPALPLRFTSTNWNMPQTVTLTAVEDGNTVSERVNVTHAASSQDNAYDTGLAIDPVVVTVRDNDMASVAGVTVTPTSRTINEGSMSTYTVVLDTRPTAAVTVMVTSGNAAVTATATPALPLRFTSTNWNMPQTVTLTAVEDGNTVSERVNVTHAASSQDNAYDTGLAIDPVVVTVRDNDMASVAGVTVTPTSRTIDEGSMRTYTVVLDTRPTAAVTVMVTSGNAAVTATATPALPLMFTSTNWNMPQTVTLTAVEDGNTVSERVNVTHAASSQDTAYDTALTIDPVVVTVRDNDMASVAGVTVTPLARIVNEGGTGTYTVVLNTLPTAEVMIAVRSEDMGAVMTTATPLRFTTGNWETAQTVTVRGVQDADMNNETVRVTHTATSTDTAYAGVTIAPVTVSVTDDDMPAGVSVSLTSLTVGEAGTSSYTLALTSPPNAEVTIMVSSVDMGAATVSPTSLTFDMNNWFMAQAVTVAGVQDADASNETVRVTHTATSTDTGYAGVTVAAVAVTVTDDDIVRPATPVATTVANEMLLPDISHVISSQVSAVVNKRVGNAASRTRTARLSIGGQSFRLARGEAGVAYADANKRAVADWIATHGEQVNQGLLDMKSVVSRTSFVLPVGETDGSARGLNSLTLWGGGNYTRISGENSAIRDWDGDIFSIQLGADAQLGDKALAGIALSRHKGDFDFMPAGATGENKYELELNSVTPYLGWEIGGVNMWTSFGYGEGEITVTDPAGVANTSDINSRTLVFGGRGLLWQGGGTQISAQGSGTLARVEIEGGENNVIPKRDVDTHQLRVVLEGSKQHRLGNGGSVNSTMEIGLRHDGGDGQGGTGVLLGLGVLHFAPQLGLSIEARVHTLLGRRGYREWGVDGLIRFGSRDGRGLHFDLTPGYGADRNDPRSVLQHGTFDYGVGAVRTASENQMRLNARLGYGMSLNGLPGLLTPYGDVRVANNNSYRLGLRWAHEALSLDLFGEHLVDALGRSDKILHLKGDVDF